MRKLKSAGVGVQSFSRCRLRRWLAVAIAGGVILLFLVGAAMLLVPLPPALAEPPARSREFLDRTGLPLRNVPVGEAWGRPVNLGQIPPVLVEATLAAEDKRFWEHPGVDWRATLRAGFLWVRHGRILSGGSTITQQLVKLAEPRPRTFPVKLLEALQALRLERTWDKPRILTAYLNRLDYGNLCFGCAEAARYYYGKPLRDLSAAEAALLAGLPQAPSRLNPHRWPERARKRQVWILERMRASGRLDEGEFARALVEPVRLQPARRPFAAPHFIDLLLGQAGTSAWPDPVPTTLDLRLNEFAEMTLRRQLGSLRDAHARNGAVVVLDNASGDVLALVGSGDYFGSEAGQVNGAWARRSAGSTFKPFTYLLAFEQGASPASVVADVPVEFPTSTGLYRPENYSRQYYGPMRYRLALANSLNVSAVQVLATVGGASALSERLKAFGLTTLTEAPDHYGLGLTLGNAEVRLLELVNAYAALARLGVYRQYCLVRPDWRRSADRNGTAVDATASAAGPGASHVHHLQCTARRVADPVAAWLVADILSDNRARAMAFGAESNLRFDFPVACKTGTSTDFRDNWAVGYTPEYTVGVWVGNSDGTPMHRVSGVSGAAPILHELFEHLHRERGTSWYAPPPQVVERWVHPITGHLVAEHQAGAVRERLALDHLPPMESTADYDAAGRVRLGREYAEWLRSSHTWLTGRAVADAGRGRGGVRVVTPQPGATYFLDPDLPEASRWLRLRADGEPGLVWESDTLEIRSAAGGVRVRLEEGKHELTVREPATGQAARTWIEVKRL